MRTETLVEIVTPAFNAERTIRETIQSVQRQTHANWRLWVVDDGSIDHTAAIVAEFSSDPRVQLVRQTNQGAPVARNTALDRVEGDFVAFLDSDDFWEPSFLARTLEELTLDPGAGMAWSDMKNHGYPGLYRDQRPPVEGDWNDTCEAIYTSVPFLPSCCLFRSGPFLRGLRWRTDCSPMEDMPIFLAVARVSRIVYVNQPLANYRIHDGSMTTSPGAIGRNYLQMVYVFRLLYRQYRRELPFHAYRRRMWYIYHHAADNKMLEGGTPILLILRAILYRPLGATESWKNLALAIWRSRSRGVPSRT